MGSKFGYTTKSQAPLPLLSGDLEESDYNSRAHSSGLFSHSHGNERYSARELQPSEPTKRLCRLLQGNAFLLRPSYMLLIRLESATEIGSLDRT